MPQSDSAGWKSMGEHNSRRLSSANDDDDGAWFKEEKGHFKLFINIVNYPRTVLTVNKISLILYMYSVSNASICMDFLNKCQLLVKHYFQEFS